MKIVKQAIQCSFFFLLIASMASCGGNSTDSSNTNNSDASTEEAASSSYSSTVPNTNLGKPTTYKLTFRTGCDEKGGTKSNVFAMIIGSEGQTKEMQLDNPNEENFVSCSQDIFDIPVDKDLGEIKEVRVWHDNAGENQSWLLELAKVQNVITGARWVFPCGKWLDKETGDQSISRILYPGKECS